MMTKAFCFGNGNSRKGLLLESFREHGTVIGCNALYRDFSPDILVALDSRIGHEIYRSGYAHKHTCYLGYWTPVPIFVAKEMMKTMADKTDIVWNDSEEVVYHGADGVFTLTKGHNLGITYITGVSPPDKVKDIEPDVDGFAYATGSRSVLLACELGAKEVYIIGHDLYSLDSKINNVYAGTNSYAAKDADYARPDNPDETYNWILQHKNTFNRFKDVQFYKVNPNELDTTPIDCKVDEWKDCVNLSYITQKEMVQSLDKPTKR